MDDLVDLTYRPDDGLDGEGYDPVWDGDGQDVYFDPGEHYPSPNNDDLMED